MSTGWLAFLHRWRPFALSEHVLLVDGVEQARVASAHTALVPLEVGPHELVVVAGSKRSAPLRVVVAENATTTVRSRQRRGVLQLEQLRTPPPPKPGSRWRRTVDDGTGRPFVPLPPADAWLEVARRDRGVAIHVVWLDGQQVAGLPGGSSVRLPVPSGRHLLLLTLNDERLQSPPAAFTLRPGETVRFGSQTAWVGSGNTRQAVGVELLRRG